MNLERFREVFDVVMDVLFVIGMLAGILMLLGVGAGLLPLNGCK